MQHDLKFDVRTHLDTSEFGLIETISTAALVAEISALER